MKIGTNWQQLIRKVVNHHTTFISVMKNPVIIENEPKLDPITSLWYNLY